MTPKERLIARLKALCNKHGVDVVADRSGVSAENLRQIIGGVKLPSGEPRGVGPKVQRKLEAQFPGWASEDAPKPPGAKFADRHEVSESDFATLQAVKTILSETELAEIRTRAADIERRVAERLGQYNKP